MTEPAPEPVVPQWQRWLLPGELLEAPGARRSARDWLVDVALLVFAILIGALALADTWAAHDTSLVVVADLVLGALATIALWARRRHASAVAVFALLASIFSAFAAGAATVALFNAALRCSPRALAAIAALSVVASALFTFVYPSGDYVAGVVLGVLITVVVVGWGLFVRARRQLVVSLRERAERLEAEQRMKMEQARDAERRRIAREMHDVLAHRVSLVGLHAGALEFRPDASPEEVAHAAGVIRAAAHSALEELREVIGVLRDGDGAAGPEPPQPTFAEIPALVEESRAAGTRVALRIETHGDDPPPALVGRTAYRVVQEGLTNARKHAPGAAVDVLISDAAEGLVVEVVSRRPVGVVAGSASPPPGTGTGLVGLAERVVLAGGRLEHGPDARGDFLLRATLPRLP